MCTSEVYIRKQYLNAQSEESGLFLYLCVVVLSNRSLNFVHKHCTETALLFVGFQASLSVGFSACEIRMRCALLLISWLPLSKRARPFITPFPGFICPSSHPLGRSRYGGRSAAPVAAGAPGSRAGLSRGRIV